jgi:peptide/nickel transport system substrate-binding protein
MRPAGSPADRPLHPFLGRRDFIGRVATIGLGAAAVPGLLPTVAACAAPDTTAKRDLVVLQWSDLTSLDPHGATYTTDCRVLSNLFDTLVRRHPDGTLHPGLATAWQRAGPTTWQLALRPDVRWHDGTRLTAVDAKYSLDRTFDPSVKAARLLPLFQTIERTETPDPGTLVIHTRRPDVLIPARLAGWGHIVPWTYIDRVGFTGFNRRPVGSGPLRFVSWTKGEQCVLEANRDYWDGGLDLDRVVFRPVPAPAARMDALLRDDADLITQLSPEYGERVASHPSTRVVGAPYAGLYVLAVNVRVAPLNQPLVRQALSLAVDRDAIVKDIWRGRGLVPNGPIPRGDNHHDPSLPPLPYNPREARDRLRRASYRGEPIVLETTNGYVANDKAMTEMIAEMWEDVGVNVVVEVIDSAVRHQKNQQKTFKGLWWSDPTSILRDPDGMMGRLLSPGQMHDYWRHPEFDRLMVEARFSGDERLRGDAYRRTTAIFLEQNPWIVVLQPYEDTGLRRYVEYTPSPDQQLELRRFNFRLRRA